MPSSRRKPEGPLRKGWTTGACATAATKAALFPCRGIAHPIAPIRRLCRMRATGGPP